MTGDNDNKQLKLREWINPRKLVSSSLSRNPSAIHFLRENPHLIDWNSLSLNSSAISLLKENRDLINLTFLKFNKNGKEIMATMPLNSNYYQNDYDNNYYRKIKEGLIKLEEIDFTLISMNPEAIDFLKDNYNKIDWYGFSENPAIFI